MINDKDFRLSDEHFYGDVTFKHQIMLLDTHCRGMEHIEQWEKKSPVGYKKTTPYTITLDGTIYEHFDSNHWSKVFGIDEIDKRIITISLENEGSLKFNAKKKKFINWSGDIYHRDKDDVHIEKWRGDMFWSPYTTNQMDSLVSLILTLNEKHNIPLKVMDEDSVNVLPEYFRGIITKHDYNTLSRDINPSFDREKFKEQIEKYEKTSN